MFCSCVLFLCCLTIMARHNPYKRTCASYMSTDTVCNGNSTAWEWIVAFAWRQQTLYRWLSILVVDRMVDFLLLAVRIIKKNCICLIFLSMHKRWMNDGLDASLLLVLLQDNWSSCTIYDIGSWYVKVALTKYTWQIRRWCSQKGASCLSLNWSVSGHFYRYTIARIMQGILNDSDVTFQLLRWWVRTRRRRTIEKWTTAKLFCLGSLRQFRKYSTVVLHV